MELRPFVADLPRGTVTGILHCVSPSAPEDRILEHVVQLRDRGRAAGLRSEVFVPDGPEVARRDAGLDKDSWRSDTLPIGDLPAHVNRSVIVYHMMDGCELWPVVYRRPEPLVLWHYGFREGPRRPSGRRDDIGDRDGAARLRLFLQRAALAVAPTAWAERQLIATGYITTGVVPAATGEASGGAADGSDADGHGSGRGVHWLSVGPMESGRGHEHVISALAVYRRAYEADARLVLVSSGTRSGYGVALASMVSELGLEEAVEVLDFSTVDATRRAELYRNCDVYVTLSEHETTGAALRDAVSASVPVVARGCGPVGEWVRGGVVLPKAAPAEVAAAVHRVALDPDVRARRPVRPAGVAANGEGAWRSFARLLGRITGELEAA